MVQGLLLACTYINVVTVCFSEVLDLARYVCHGPIEQYAC